MALTRLDKILCDSGFASRSEARQLIKVGRVKVDETVVRAADAKFDPALVQIKLDGALINGVKYRYFIINKPQSCITATEDREQKTVLDLFPAEIRRLGIFPVGRLDKDTTGLLIFTNDGDYAHRVISPRNHVEKCYIAEIEKPIRANDIKRFAKGITLRDGTVCASAKLEVIDDSHCKVIITEGKYHQVRRMLAACENYVISLHRQSIGSLNLPEDLGEGEIIELTDGAEQLVFEK